MVVSLDGMEFGPGSRAGPSCDIGIIQFFRCSGQCGADATQKRRLRPGKDALPKAAGAPIIEP